MNDFFKTRQVIETRIFEDIVLHPFSIKERSGGINTLAENKNLVLVHADNNGIYKKIGTVKIYREDETVEDENVFVKMSIDEAATKGLKGTSKTVNTVSSGFVKFSINIKNTDNFAIGNKYVLASLIANAIELRFGGKTGSKTSDLQRYPDGAIGGTLLTYIGGLTKINDEDGRGFLIYHLINHFDYYKE